MTDELNVDAKGRVCQKRCGCGAILSRVARTCVACGHVFSSKPDRRIERVSVAPVVPVEAAVAPLTTVDFDCIDGPEGMTLVVQGKRIALTDQQRTVVLMEVRMAHA